MKYIAIILFIGMFMLRTVSAQSLTTRQINFLEGNLKIIYQDSLQTHPDWSALLPAIKDKKIILIGEFNHGSKEIFEVRNSLIKYLHQEKGVNAVLFETGMGELITAEIHRVSMSAAQMANSLVGVWRTKEFVELMDYVKSHDISIAGFDVQRTGGSFNSILNNLTQTYKLDTLTTYNLESRYGLLVKELTDSKTVYDSLKTRTIELMQDYQKVKAKLSLLTTSDTPRDLSLAASTLENRIIYLSYMMQFLKDKDWSKRWAARDSAMANNTQWLLENFYKDQQVIILAHNFHVGKYNENETVMGEILKARYNLDMYAIGLFAGSGSYSDNFGKEVMMTPQESDELDMKQIIASMNGTVAFLDIPHKFSKASNWLNQPITINDTFIDLKNGNKLILAKTFDGLILLKKVSPSKID